MPLLAPDAVLQTMMTSTYRLAYQLSEHLLATFHQGHGRQRKTLNLLHSVVCSICDRSSRLGATEHAAGRSSRVTGFVARKARYSPALDRPDVRGLSLREVVNDLLALSRG